MTRIFVTYEKVCKYSYMDSHTAFTLRVMLLLLAKISVNAIAKCINTFMS